MAAVRISYVVLFALAVSVLVQESQADTPANGPAAAANMATGTVTWGVTEAQQRSQVLQSDFVTDFSAIANTAGIYADARYALGQVSPALYTLPGDGLAQGVVQLGYCALFALHYHPRASEILYIAQGSVNISFVEENKINVGGRSFGGNTMNFTVNAGQNVIIPQALMHFIYNPNCSNATMITSFSNRDPGAVSVVQGLFGLDPTIVQASTGLDGQLQTVVRSLAASTPVVSVDTTCLTKCKASPAPPATQSSG